MIGIPVMDFIELSASFVLCVSYCAKHFPSFVCLSSLSPCVFVKERDLRSIFSTGFDVYTCLNNNAYYQKYKSLSLSPLPSSHLHHNSQKSMHWGMARRHPNKNKHGKSGIGPANEDQLAIPSRAWFDFD